MLLEGHEPFPDPALALWEPNGLLAIGGDLSPPRLLMAYRAGIFPWYEKGPILWWSPDPRTVLFLKDFHVSRRLQKTRRQQKFVIKVDENFRAVVQGCAAPRRNELGTWINQDMQEAYCALFELGYAHSVEVYRDERLVGGLYGVSLGRLFFAESMFSLENDTSKIALWELVNILTDFEFELIDCQFYSTHLGTLGAVEIPRSLFLQKIANNNKFENKIGKWKFTEKRL